jgi:hypothetical protein
VRLNCPEHPLNQAIATVMCPMKTTRTARSKCKILNVGHVSRIKTVATHP